MEYLKTVVDFVVDVFVFTCMFMVFYVSGMAFLVMNTMSGGHPYEILHYIMLYGFVATYVSWKLGTVISGCVIKMFFKARY